MKGAKELIEQGLISGEMGYFVKETIIYVLVVVFERSQIAESCQEPVLTPQGFCTGHRSDRWCDAFACGIWTREHMEHMEVWIKKNHILAVGCPASEYCKKILQELEPIYLPNKETRPKDPI